MSYSLPNLVLRDMELTDIDAVMALGHADSAFAVSQQVRFYERAELEQWLTRPGDTILLVATVEGVVQGFLVCKIMSYHWAMLDNFYALPVFRGRGLGTRLMQSLLDRLQIRQVSYLTTLVAVDDLDLTQYLRRFGFRATKTYEWHELFLPSRTVGEPS